MSSTYAKLYWIHALTPLHIGAGQGLGFIDLPIMREKATGWPLVPGSSVKGAWRALVKAGEHANLEGAIFGESGASEGHAGSVVFGDAHIAFLPVRSLYGTFAYVTTLSVLQRLQRDIRLAAPEGLPLSARVEGAAALCSRGTCLSREGQVFLEDLDLTVTECDRVTQLARTMSGWIYPNDEFWRNAFSQRVLVVPGNVFDYLAEQATEVVARVSLKEGEKIVDKGPWYEESLPAETILLGLLWCDRVAQNASDLTPQELMEKVFEGSWNCQMGGNQTIGSGRVRCVFSCGREV